MNLSNISNVTRNARFNVYVWGVCSNVVNGDLIGDNVTLEQLITYALNEYNAGNQIQGTVLSDDIEETSTYYTSFAGSPDLFLRNGVDKGLDVVIEVSAW